MKIAIIGAGPAGIQTALQLKRYGIESTIFEKDSIGGLLLNAACVENILGFHRKSGIEIIDEYKKHLNNYDINIIYDEVIKLDLINDNLSADMSENFIIKTKNNSEYIFDIVVIASGTNPIQFKYDKELSRKLMSKIHYDLKSIANIKNKNILISGGGDAAFDYALNLSKDNNITILNRTRNIKALKVLKEEVFNCKNINYIEDAQIIDIENTDTHLINSIKINNKILKIKSDILVIAWGRKENKSFYSENIFKLEEKLLSLGLIYLAGDVKNSIFRQTQIALADGIKCAMDIYFKISTSHH